MAPVDQLQLFENRLRDLAKEKSLKGLDEAFKQAKREHQNLADQAQKLLEIKQKIELEMKGLS